MNNGIKLSVLSLSLGVLNIFGMAQQNITLISSDGQHIPISSEAASLSEKIKVLVGAIGQAEEALRGEVSFRYIDGATLQNIVNILTHINQQIQMQRAGQLPREKTIRIGEHFVTPNVQEIVDPVLEHLKPDAILQVVVASDFLELPFLVNAAAKVYIDKMIEQRPDVEFAVLESIFRVSGVPQNVFPYFKKHFELKKIGAPGELSIEDYIAMYGQPIGERVTMQRGIVHRLPAIILNNKNITSLEGIELIENPENIEAIDLIKNYISEIPDQIFNKFKNLKGINISNNYLQVLPANIFEGLKELGFIAFSNNKLQTLPANVFAGLNNLERLILSNNKFSTLPDRIFDKLHRLRVLELQNNQLQRLQDGIFIHLNNLHQLNLKNNKLEMFSNHTFAGLNNLHQLNLEDNPLKESAQEIKKKYFSDNPDITIAT